MKKNNGQTWLFSFTDLAFLLLISLSTIPVADTITIRFSEMDVPVVPESQSLSPLGSLAEIWELQVHPVSQEQPVPYRIVRSGLAGTVREDQPLLLGPDELLDALETLKARRIQPMLLPEKTSLSQDLLYAAGAMARVWGTDYGETVVRPDVPEGGS